MERINELVVFDNLLKEEEYKSHNKYVSAVKDVLKSNNIDIPTLLENISYYIYAYAYGNLKSENKPHGTVSAALKKFKQYFVDMKYDIRLKFLDDKIVDFEDYANLENMNKAIDLVVNDGENSENRYFAIESIKPGCSEFFVSLSNVLSIISVGKGIFSVINTWFLFKRIFRGEHDLINSLNWVQNRSLLIIAETIYNHLKKHGHSDFELWTFTGKIYVSFEDLEKIVKHLSKH